MKFCRFSAFCFALLSATAACTSHPPDEATGPARSGSLFAPSLAVQTLAADQPAAPDARQTPVIFDLQLAAQGQAQAVAEEWAADYGAEILRVYPNLGAVALQSDAETLRQIARDPRVAGLQPDRALRTGKLAAAPTASQVVGATKAHALYGVSGSGVRIAVLDSGVDNGHADLAGRIVAQACFSQGGCPGGGKQGGSAQDANGHGTHVASVLVGAGKVAPMGIAPEAKLVAVRVFGANGSGPTSDMLAGLDWLIGQATALNVRVLNLSLGSQEVFGGPCDKADPVTAKALKILAAKGVAVFVAAGNDGALGAISTPACISTALAVGATYAGNYGAQGFGALCSDATTGASKMACFSNRSKQVTVVAPGAFLVGAGLGGGTATMAGTSQATPVAAGVGALLAGCNPKLTPAQIGAILRKSGKPIFDAATGLQLSLVQAGAAAQLACPIAP